MSLTQAGFLCDVCGQFMVTEMLGDRGIEQFTTQKDGPMMHCHDKCKQALIDCDNDWQKLPDGPLRQAYEKASLRVAEKCSAVTLKERVMKTLKKAYEKPSEFPCLNPNHQWDNDAVLYRKVLKAWIDGERVVRITCPYCKENNEPGFRDLFKPNESTLAIMIEAVS